MASSRDKPLARNVGQFFGHLFRAFKSQPESKQRTVRKTTEEEDRGDVVLRRTTIEEVEFKHEEPDGGSPAGQGRPDP